MSRRRKIYYPASQITNGLYTSGGEWMYEDGTEYIGPYHTYLTGEVFSHGEWNERFSKRLVRFERRVDVVETYRRSKFMTTDPITGEEVTIQSDTDILTYTAPKHRIVKPTDDDYNRGYFTRYIMGKRNDEQYPLKELSQTDYELYESNGVGINKYLYKIVEVKWKLTGPEFDVVENGRIKTSGVVDTNRRTVFSANRHMFGVSNFLRDLREHTVYASPITGDNSN